LAASPGAILIVTAATGLDVEPNAGGTVEGTTTRLAGASISEEFRQEIRAIPFESFPGVFAALVEQTIERRMGDDQAAGSAALARLDDGKRPG